MKKFFLLLPLVLLASLGCKSTLAPGGAYAPVTTNATTGIVTSSPDMAFYTADSTFFLAYTTLDAVFSIERDNREAFWKISPSIKHTLDSIRPTALTVVQDYLKARAAYIANPTPVGLTGIQAILARVQQLLSAAQAALPALSGTVTTNAPPAAIAPPSAAVWPLENPNFATR